MPFLCNGLMLCCDNIPTVLLMFFNKFSSCSVPYFNLFFIEVPVGLRTAPWGTLASLSSLIHTAGQSLMGKN